MVATTIVFFPAAPLFLFMKGKDIVIPEGMPVTAFVQGDMRLDMAKMVLPTTADSPRTTVTAANEAPASSLTVEAKHPGRRDRG